ncbi:MAG: hypothetical protein J5I65_15990 [Aridibacter famidurans]|nr:hypothetical protein [Aridibacter famidurans]
MSAAEWLKILRGNIAALPIQDCEAFQRLWHDGRLRFTGAQPDPNALDALSAALVCSCLDNEQRLLIVLPDRSPSRSALLFAAGLIINAIDSIDLQRAPQRVLYAGSHIGIRDQLSRVWINNLRLDNVFAQDRASGRKAGVSNTDSLAEYLPQVLTAYAPSDPASLLAEYRPAWIAVDCGEGHGLKWLEPLLKSTADSKIPLVGWCQNPLADTVEIFSEQRAQVFRWPSSTQISLDQQGLTYPITRLGAISLEGRSTEAVEPHLQQACDVLADLTKRNLSGRMERDALSVAWRQLRLLESLTIPLDIHEAEAPSYWGLHTVRHGIETLVAFAEALRASSPSVASSFASAGHGLELAIEGINQFGPPHWHALTEMCVTDVEADAARLLLFPSDARCQLFELSLLADYNISLEDLAALRTTLLSARDFYGKGRRPWLGHPDREDVPGFLRATDVSSWQVIVAGLPSSRLLHQLEPGLRTGMQIDFLLYSYQLPNLSWRLDRCIDALSVPAAETTEVLSVLGSEVEQASLVDVLPPLSKGETSAFSIKEKREAQRFFRSNAVPSLELDPAVEAAWLFADEADDPDEEADLIRGGDGQASEGTAGGASLFVPQAIEITFEEGWCGLFAPDATLNVLTQQSGNHDLQPRYMRAIRTNDLILFIHGQRRQNLYELIVQRIHNHPAFAIHTELIARWQRDIVTSYNQWCKKWGHQRGAEELYMALHSRGCTRSKQAVAQWVQGLRLRTQDREDMRRLAEVLGMDFVRRHYRRIHDAAGRIHGIHIQLGKMLTDWLLHGHSAAGELLDRELGLSFEDLKSSLLRLRVKSKQIVDGPFYHEHLGTLEQL